MIPQIFRPCHIPGLQSHSCFMSIFFSWIGRGQKIKYQSKLFVICSILKREEDSLDASLFLSETTTKSVFTIWFLVTSRSTDYGYPERASFQKFETFGLGQINWAEIFWGIWGISSQTISTILALWVPCAWENVAGSFSHKKLWFLGLKHITPKCSQNKILAIKNLEKSLHTSVFGEPIQWKWQCTAKLLIFHQLRNQIWLSTTKNICRKSINVRFSIQYLPAMCIFAYFWKHFPVA